MVIHKGNYVQDNWTRKAPGNVQVAATSKGYITKAKFHEYDGWFVAHLKQNGLLGIPHMLICDCHSSHLYNLPFFLLMKRHKIHVFSIPPHTSHLLQPLDKTLFAQFKIHWEKHLTQYINENKGKCLNKVDFWDVFTPAFNAAISLKNILSGFKKTGISPYDPSVIPIHEMGPSNVTEKGIDLLLDLKVLIVKFTLYSFHFSLYFHVVYHLNTSFRSKICFKIWFRIYGVFTSDHIAWAIVIFFVDPVARQSAADFIAGMSASLPGPVPTPAGQTRQPGKGLLLLVTPIFQTVTHMVSTSNILRWFNCIAWSVTWIRHLPVKKMFSCLPSQLYRLNTVLMYFQLEPNWKRGI